MFKIIGWCSLLVIIIFPLKVEAYQATVMAYSELDSCHFPNCIMSSGKRAYIGAVACPRKYKLGTKVNIGGKD